MWAQQWDNIEKLVRPFNDTPILDVTEAMKTQVFGIVINRLTDYEYLQI